MKRKMISVVAMMMVAALTLGGCGGKKNSELDEDDLELINELKEEASSPSGVTLQASASNGEQSATSEEVAEEITFECLPEMKAYTVEDMKIQINDFVLDFDLSMTVEEAMEIIEGSSLHYTVSHGQSDPYVPDEWVEASDLDLGDLNGKGRELLIFRCDEQKDLSFALLTANFSGDPKDLKDTIIYSVAGSLYLTQRTKNIWFPGGIRIDGDGLNYENVSDLFPGEEAEDISSTIWRPDESGLYWNSKDLYYAYFLFRNTEYTEKRGNTILFRDRLGYYFYIDKTTKEVSLVEYVINDIMFRKENGSLTSRQVVIPYD